MRRIVIVVLFLLLSFASIGIAELLGDCLCEFEPYQAKIWQGFCAIGDADFYPTDDPDEEYLATRMFPNVIEWMLLKIQVNDDLEANFSVRIPNREVRDCHYFLIKNSGKIVANINLTELSGYWYSVTAYFLPGETTDFYYLVWVE